MRSLAFGILWTACVGLPAGEVIDVAHLDTRGVVFEAPREGLGELAANSISGAGGVGDVNGDGFDDVGLAIYRFLWGASQRQGVLIVFGRPEMTGRRTLEPSLPGYAFFVITPGVEKWSSSDTPTPLGDVNGDGFADFSMSMAPNYGTGSGGKVLLVYGSRDLMGDYAVEDVGSKIPGLVLTSSDPGMLGMFPAVPIGDFNGDGSTDLAIGAPSSLLPQDTAGAGLIVILSDIRSLSSPVDLALVGKTIPGSKCCRRLNNLGVGILAVGDVDGDGFEDVALTASGEIYLVRGDKQLPPVLDPAPENVITFYGPSLPGERRWFAGRNSMASLGDLNGDGFSDFAFGVYRFCCTDPSPGPEDDPGVYVFYGGPDFPREIDFNDLSEEQYAFVIRSPGLFSVFGFSMAGGDLNGDGLWDLVIGAHHESPNGLSKAGEAYVLYGRRDFPKEVFLENAFEAYTLRGESVNDQLGYGVEQPGDFNGDGVPDVLVLARHVPSNPLGPARLYLLYGTGSGPEPLRFHSIAPAWGTVRGGTRVVLNGSGFEGRADVFFADRAAANVVALSRSQLQVETPPGASVGLVEVSVRIDGETRSLARSFEYTPNFPTIDLDTLGDQGFILDGIGTQKFAHPSNSTLAFGDLTGDGVDDLVVESPLPNSWRVTVIRGGADLPPTLLAGESPRIALIVPSEIRSGSGATVTVLGNVNAEGQRDLAIGTGDDAGYILFAPPFDAAGESLGILDIDAAVLAGSAVRIVPGGAFDPSPMLIFAPMGDINGDGIDDFAVGLPGGDVAPPGSGAGDIVLVAGRRSWEETVDLSEPSVGIARIRGSQADKRFAGRLRAVGDVNRDGVVDLLADSAAMFHGSGHAYLLYGSKSFPADIDVEKYISLGGGVVIDILDGFDAFDWFSVSAAGDVNADGFSDVLLGVEGGGGLLQGFSYLIYGAPDLPSYLELEENPSEPDGIVRIFGAGSSDYASRVGMAGDFNVDGFADFLIGSPGFQKLDEGEGKVYLIFGGAALPERIELRHLGSHGLKIKGRNILGGAGHSSGPAGDFNGDGLSDFAFSEAGLRAGDVSHVYVIYNPFDGVPFIRGDANSDGAVNIADAIFTLTYLFLGGVSPLCEDALDADDSGTLEITDAVRILNYLFLGAVELPAPHPNAGQDPTAGDGLDCLGF